MLNSHLMQQAYTEKQMIKYMDECRPQSFASLYNTYLYLCSKINQKPLDNIVAYYKNNNCEKYRFER